MQKSFGQTLPDLVGFFIVGATVGTILMGGADSGITMHSALGCLGGGVLVPVAFVIPWMRLLRRRGATETQALLG